MIAAVKLRRVAALEAYALRRPSPDDRFVGYLHELNLFNAPCSRAAASRGCAAPARSGRYRLELETLVAAPRRSRAAEQAGPQPATIPA